jgi:RNA polymerase sigma-B factor
MHASRLLSQALAWLRDALLSDDPLQWKAGRGAGTDGPRLGVQTAVVRDAVVVEIRGELERDTAEQLRRALSTALRLGPAAQLRVDLRGVPFIDAAAISALIGAGETARRAGMRLSLVGARRHVAQALATAGLWPYLDRESPPNREAHPGSAAQDISAA